MNNICGALPPYLRWSYTPIIYRNNSYQDNDNYDFIFFQDFFNPYKSWVTFVPNCFDFIFHIVASLILAGKQKACRQADEPFTAHPRPFPIVTRYK